MREPAASRSDKFIVGVTGNIATGKSVVMRLAVENGALAIDADKLVHEIMDSDVEMQAAIAVAFGSEVRHPSGRIDRRSLGEIVFDDADAMRDLEAMIHPAVSKEVSRRLSQTDSKLIFIEAIKLLEGELADLCHQVWVTRCTKKTQLERLRICRGMDTPSAALRIKAQSPQEDKVALADVVIDTDGYMTDTAAQLERAWARLPKWATEAAARAAEAPAPADDWAKTPPLGTATERVSIPSAPKASARKGAQAESAAGMATDATTDSADQVPEDAAARIDETYARPDNLEVRRARPSDIPSVLLLIQKATDGAVKMKRAELLMAFSERSYFIGQAGTDVNTVMGFSIDSQVARIDQVFIHPVETGMGTAMAVIEEIEKSAKAHICELVITFLAKDALSALRQLFTISGYEEMAKEGLPRAWQNAIDESQPEDTFFLVKILRGERMAAH